jgi:hypothetical protein
LTNKRAGNREKEGGENVFLFEHIFVTKRERGGGGEFHCFIILMDKFENTEPSPMWNRENLEGVTDDEDEDISWTGFKTICMPCIWWYSKDPPKYSEM